MIQGLISVIIPAYNHEAYVGETLQSLLNQTYKNIELIILNDGSPDNTAAVIESYLPRCEERFQRVVYIDKSNEGTVKTLNKGLDLAQGEYVALGSSDDTYKKEAMQILYNFLSISPTYGVVVGDNDIMDSNSTQCYWDVNQNVVYNKSEASFITFGECIRRRGRVDFFSDDFGSYTSLLYGNYMTNGTLIRKFLLDEIGGFSESAPLEDHHLMLQLSKRTKFKFIDKSLMNYRWHAGNTSKQKSKMKRMARLTLLQEKNYAEANGYQEEFRAASEYRKRFGIPGALELALVTQRHFQRRVDVVFFGITLIRIEFKPRKFVPKLTSAVSLFCSKMTKTLSK